jgi:DNA-binding MarR family transcriptional regulator
MDYKKIYQRKQIGRNISICFRTSKSILQKAHNESKFKITIAELPVLSFLLDDDNNNKISQDFITKSLGIDKASTTRAVKKLCEHGYIKREKDKRDKRAYNLSLTEEGKKLKLHIMTVLLNWTDIVYQGISQDEIDLLENITNKMINNIKKYKEEQKYENC